MNKKQQLKTSWLKFYTWWIDSILLLFPMWLRQIINPAKDNLIIECDAEHVSFRFISSQKNVEEKYCCPLDDDIEIASAGNWLKNKTGTTTRLFLQLADNKIIRKKLTLPLATKENLQQVLSFEMERHTPFKPEQAYFDYSIKDNIDNNKLLVWFYVTPRSYIDQSLEKLKAFNILPDIACSNELETSEIKLNFLPQEKRQQKNSSQNNSLWYFAATTLTMFLAVLYFPVFQLYQQSNTLQTEIELYRNKAITAKKLQEEKDTILLKTNFLLTKQKKYFPVINLLNELTRIIPDDTWLSELSFTQHNIKIQGESDDASSIIEVIESSEKLHDSSFISPIVSNNIDNKDKFKLSAKIKKQSL